MQQKRRRLRQRRPLGRVRQKLRVLLARRLSLAATKGNAQFLERLGLPVTRIGKVHESGPNVLDAIREGQIQLIIHTPLGSQAHDDGRALRGAAHQYHVPITTTLSAAQATVQGIRALRQKPLKVRSLQIHHGRR